MSMLICVLVHWCRRSFILKPSNSVVDISSFGYWSIGKGGRTKLLTKDVSACRWGAVDDFTLDFFTFSKNVVIVISWR